MYDLVDNRTKQILDVFEDFKRDDFVPVKTQVSVNRDMIVAIQTRLVVAGTVIIFVVNVVWDFIKEKFIHG